jgi:hypothetical protein
MLAAWSGNAIGDGGAVALADALKLNHGITTVQLHSTPPPLIQLRRARRQTHTCLAHAVNNGIGDRGATALADAMKENATLKVVDLRCELTRARGGVHVCVCVCGGGGAGLTRDVTCHCGGVVTYVPPRGPCAGTSITSVGAALMATALKTNFVMREVRIQDAAISAEMTGVYRVPHVRFIIRTRYCCLTGGRARCDARSEVIAWLCQRAPLWVVVHVCALLRDA